MGPQSNVGLGPAQRNPALILATELPIAAAWWCRNVTRMPECDPWRGHLASIVFAALLAPKATDLELWLRHAHTAVCGASSLQSSCYAQARMELLSERPPWLLSREDIEAGFPGIHEHRARWFEAKCVDEMGRLLDQIKADGAIDVAPKGLVTL